jgi:hypothetical protein
MTDVPGPSAHAAESPVTGKIQFARTINTHKEKGLICRVEQPLPDEVKWAEEHEPAAAASSSAAGSDSADSHSSHSKPNLPGSILTPVLPGSRIKRRSGAVPVGAAEGLRGNGADGDAKASMSEEELQALEDSHTVVYSRTLTCNAPRLLLWRHLMNKIRHPQCYTNARNVKILCEGKDFVYRDVTVGPPNCPEEDLVVVREKVTWSEEDEEVRFALYEDEVKEGYIENSITLDASGAVCLTVSCRWTFNPHAGMSDELLQVWRNKLKCGLDAGCIKTVRVVEEEQKQLLQERRRRHSVSQVAEQAEDKVLREMAAKHGGTGTPRGESVAAASSSHSLSPRPSAASTNAAPAPAASSSSSFSAAPSAAAAPAAAAPTAAVTLPKTAAVADAALVEGANEPAPVVAPAAEQLKQ